MMVYGVRRVSFVLAAALLAATSSVSITIAQAQQQSAQRQISFNIPAKPVTQAVNDIGRVAGLSVVFRENQAITASGRAVRGTMTAEAALSMLLNGTGLTYRFSNATTVQIFDPSASASNGAAISADGTTVLNTITVEGNSQSAWGSVDGIVATQSSTATKTDTPLIETPQSISVITRDRMDVQDVNRLDEAVRYTAGVRSDYGGAVVAADNIFIRGQYINTYTDGLRETPFSYFGIMATEPFAVERVEVLKGPVSVLYGQNQPGGMINLVTKRPTDFARGEVQTSIGTNNHKQVTVDVSGPLNDEKTVLGRFVALGRLADGTVDYTDDDRLLIAPSITFKRDEETQLTFFGSYQRNKALAVTNFPWAAVNGSSSFGRMPMHRFLGEPGFDAETQEKASFGYEFSHQINSNISFKQNFRYSNFENQENYLARNSGLLYSDVTGGATAIARNWQFRHAFGDTVGLDNQFNVKAETGPFEHNALFGFDYAWSRATRDEKWGTGPRIENIFSPQYGSPIDFSSWNSWVNGRTTTSQYGLYAQDQIAYDKWRLTVGLRQDWINAKVDDLWDGDTGTSSRPKSATALQDSSWNALTGRAGLTYLFDNGIAPYISYSESFNPVVGEDRFGTAFEPEKNRQYEVGVKYQPEGWDGFFTVSAFDLTRTNVTTADPDDLTKSAQIGEVRSRGFEFEATAQLSDGLSLISAYTYLDSKVTKATAEGSYATEGKQLIRVPNHMASAWLDYEVQSGVLEGLGVSGGVRYTGSSWGDALNTFKTPSYTLVDAALRYDFGKKNPELEGLTAKVNFTNLFDKYYVSSCFFTLACNVGEGRSVVGTLQYKW